MGAKRSSKAIRAVEAAEIFALQIDTDASYPVEFVVFRLTGYRPDDAPNELVPGSVLRGDLGVLAEHISRRASLETSDLAGTLLGLSDLEARWQVSRKTIERFRRRGLVGARVRSEDARERVVFRTSTVESFERAHADEIESARAFSRMPAEEERAIFEQARALRAAHGWSMHRCARELARAHARGVETIRSMLRRNDADHRVFPDPPPPDARLSAVFERALRRGIEPRDIAERSGYPRRSVLRAADLRRLAMLRDALHADGLLPGREPIPHEPPDEPSPGAIRAALDEPGVRGVTRPERPASLLELLTFMRERVVPVGIEERHQLTAIALLVASARGIVLEQTRADTPSPTEIDRAETALRRASLLTALALRPHLRLILDTLERGSPGVLDDMKPEPLRGLLRRALRAAGGAALAIDPAHGGRLAAPVGLAAQRVVASERSVPERAGRARGRLPGDTPAPDWTRTLHPWQEWLEPPPGVAYALRLDTSDDARLLADRLGLERLAEARADLARSLRTTPARLAVIERRALRAAWQRAGSPRPPPT